MAKNLYIDASHPNETRVVLKSEENIEDYEYESISNSFIKNNIYLGKVSRVEPSLKAAWSEGSIRLTLPKYMLFLINVLFILSYS